MKNFIILFIISCVLVELKTSQKRTEESIEQILGKLTYLQYYKLQIVKKIQRVLDMLSNIDKSLPKKIRSSKYRNYPFNSQRKFKK